MMDDELIKQIGDILEAKDCEALVTLYTSARQAEDFRLAHELLLELTIKLLDRSTKIIADMRRQQERNLREINSIKKRLASLLKTA